METTKPRRRWIWITILILFTVAIACALIYLFLLFGRGSGLRTTASNCSDRADMVVDTANLASQAFCSKAGTNLTLAATDQSKHTCQIVELGKNISIPAGGKSASFTLPAKPDGYKLNCGTPNIHAVIYVSN